MTFDLITNVLHHFDHLNIDNGSICSACLFLGRIKELPKVFASVGEFLTGLILNKKENEFFHLI